MRKIVLQLFIVAVCICSPAFGATFTIPDGDVTALIKAINDANTNGEADVINLATNGTYTLFNINFTSTNAATTGNAGQRGLPEIVNNVAGLDLTINGNGATIQRNIAAVQFGLFSASGQTIFNNITFRNGRVIAQGAAIFVQFKGNVEIANCKFYNNVSLLDAEGGGGAIYTKSLSVLKVADSYFENNTAINQGGAISNLLSDMTVINSKFINNSTTDLVGGDPAGGAIYVDGARGDNGQIIIRNNLFDTNKSNGLGQGGAMFLFPYNNQSVEVTRCTFTNNSANQGGALWHKGGGSSGIADSEIPLSNAAETTTLLFNSCVFDGNTATNALGGALWISDCIIGEIYDCTFKNNTASLGGAVALLTNRPFTFRNSTFNNNNADQSGAIFVGVSAPLNINNCTFYANIANQYGGALSVPMNGQPVTISNCTFANNQANNPDNGQSGAIHSGTNGNNSTVTVRNTIFSNNTVTNRYGGNGTSLWRDCNAILNNGGNNIFWPSGTAQSCVSPLTFANPMLGPLADNGGATQTMALLAGSAAIDTGAGCGTLDQRNAIRTGVCDIGAYEYNGILGSPALDAIQQLTIYPNPTKDVINIEFNTNNNESLKFIITDALGRELNSVKANTVIGANKQELNFTNYPTGVYLVTITNGKDVKVTKRIIKN